MAKRITTTFTLSRTITPDPLSTNAKTTSTMEMAVSVTTTDQNTTATRSLTSGSLTAVLPCDGLQINGTRHPMEADFMMEMSKLARSWAVSQREFKKEYKETKDIAAGCEMWAKDTKERMWGWISRLRERRNGEPDHTARQFEEWVTQVANEAEELERDARQLFEQAKEEEAYAERLSEEWGAFGKDIAWVYKTEKGPDLVCPDWATPYVAIGIVILFCLVYLMKWVSEDPFWYRLYWACFCTGWVIAAWKLRQEAIILAGGFCIITLASVLAQEVLFGR